MEINVNGNVTINDFSANEQAGANWDASKKERMESSPAVEENINPEEVTAPTKFAEQLIDENATLNELLLALAANPDAQNAAANEVADKEDEEKEKELRAKFGEDYNLVFENKPELQKQKRRPGAIQLRLNCVCVALAEGAGSGICEVYSNGYAVYDNGNRRTVISRTSKLGFSLQFFDFQAEALGVFFHQADIRADFFLRPGIKCIHLCLLKSG